MGTGFFLGGDGAREFGGIYWMRWAGAGARGDSGGCERNTQWHLICGSTATRDARRNAIRIPAEENNPPKASLGQLKPTELDVKTTDQQYCGLYLSLHI